MTQPHFEPPKKTSTTSKVFLGVFVAILVLGVSGAISNQETPVQSQSNTVVTPPSTAWVPTGYDLWDSEVAYKWADDPTCDTYSVCAAIRVVANKDCLSNLYAELTIQDENYVQYDYTNDSQGSLYRGDIAELTFNFPPDERFAHFKVSKISCY
jgi:hypothetical protein